jgi:hypothetical protein
MLLVSNKYGGDGIYQETKSSISVGKRTNRKKTTRGARGHCSLDAGK